MITLQQYIRDKKLQIAHLISIREEQAVGMVITWIGQYRKEIEPVVEEILLKELLFDQKRVSKYRLARTKEKLLNLFGI